MDESGENRPPSPSQLSKTPSWVMLGFVLGAIFVIALPRREPPPAPLAAPEMKAPAPVALSKPGVERAIFFEDVFAEWQRPAVWENDLTEVAFWSEARRAFSDCYEVLRVDGKFYFRSIPHLTRPVSRRTPANSPLLFTVPAADEAGERGAGEGLGRFFGAPRADVKPPVPARPKPAERPAPELPPKN
ncbi:MAG: hypothetical protein EXS32_16290 [Opitutus sp.]|nr:hypothetical protein [Opitutus sp.]